MTSLEDKYPEYLYGPRLQCRGTWRSDTPPGDPHRYIPHECKLIDVHEGPHECGCGETLNWNLPGPPDYVYGTGVVASSGKGRVFHVADGHGKTLCGKFFSAKPGTLPQGCPICKPHLSPRGWYRRSP